MIIYFFSLTLIVFMAYLTLFVLQNKLLPTNAPTYIQTQQEVSADIGQLVAGILRGNMDGLTQINALRFGESMSAWRATCIELPTEKAMDCVTNIVQDANEFFKRKKSRKYTDEELILQITNMLHDIEKNRKIAKNWSDHQLHQLNIHTPNYNKSLPAWKVYQNNISKQGLYLTKDLPNIEQLLNDLVYLKIVEIEEIPEDGTQIKFILVLEDGSRALFKPMRVYRDNYETLDIYYMYEKERHTAEIAAFHLNRILGFNNVPPVAGRILDMEDELYKHLSFNIQQQFFYSPINNLCFFAECEYFCSAAHAVCGKGTQLEGSMAAFNPDEGPDENLLNYWQRSYSKYNKTEWELTDSGENYCAEVRKNKPYNHDKTMLNVIDTVIFDFLIGNKDRHHFYTFERYTNNSALILYDNGKGFGRAHDDIIDILAPLYQCCLIRYTTLRMFHALHISPSPLSARMRRSLNTDKLRNILTEAHFRSLDRRVAIVLETVLNCFRQRPGQNIIIDDQYYYERG